MEFPKYTTLQNPKLQTKKRKKCQKNPISTPAQSPHHTPSSRQSSHLSTPHPRPILILTAHTISCKLPASRSSVRASQTNRAVSSSVLGRGIPSPAEEYEEVEERLPRSISSCCRSLSSRNTLPVSCCCCCCCCGCLPEPGIDVSSSPPVGRSWYSPKRAPRFRVKKEFPNRRGVLVVGR